MLTIGDIPDEFRKGRTDGENVARLASGVQQALHATGGAWAANGLLAPKGVGAW